MQLVLIAVVLIDSASTSTKTPSVRRTHPGSGHHPDPSPSTRHSRQAIGRPSLSPTTLPQSILPQAPRNSHASIRALAHEDARLPSPAPASRSLCKPTLTPSPWTLRPAAPSSPKKSGQERLNPSPLCLRLLQGPRAHRLADTGNHASPPSGLLWVLPQLLTTEIRLTINRFSRVAMQQPARIPQLQALTQWTWTLLVHRQPLLPAARKRRRSTPKALRKPPQLQARVQKIPSI